MTVAEETRAAVRERPYLYNALRAGVVNYAAAAATLDIDADADAVATALRRFANELAEAADGDPDPGVDADARVRMRRGVGPVTDRDEDADTGTADTDAPADEAALLTAGDTTYVAGAGDATALVATGDVGPRALEAVLGRLRVAGVAVDAAGMTATGLAVVVDRRAGADALRAVEAALDG